MTVLNTPNRNRSWTAEQLAEGAKLAGLIALGQEPKGFAVDSVGQWFRVKDALLIPSPEPVQPQRSLVPIDPLSR